MWRFLETNNTAPVPPPPFQRTLQTEQETTLILIKTNKLFPTLYWFKVQNF